MTKARRTLKTQMKITMITHYGNDEEYEEVVGNNNQDKLTTEEQDTDILNKEYAMDDEAEQEET